MPILDWAFVLTCAYLGFIRPLALSFWGYPLAKPPFWQKVRNEALMRFKRKGLF